ncbi:MAG: sigma-70 family RNA polymerase sigma factor [Acidobacteria bacterium]|nr:sigma-70 family RNA polymerase sigma factor [Acidobacteriota bacterium]
MNAADLRHLIALSIRRTAHEFSVLIHPEDVEDLTQDVLLRLWERQPECAPECRTAYIRRVARNLTVDALRRRGAAKRSDSRTFRLDDVTNLRDRSPGPLTLLVAREELQQRITACRRHLSDSQLHIFFLVYLNDLKTKEAVRITGQSISAIDSTIYRARRRLRENGIHVKERIR